MIHNEVNFYRSPKIGKGTSIGAYCDIGGCVIGENCKIQTGVSIPPGWTIGNNVFIGPGARFANDRKPSLKALFAPLQGFVEDDVVIGMNASIGAGITLGNGCVIGMGAVVLKNVPAGETWVGNPAKCIGYPSSS